MRTIKRQNGSAELSIHYVLASAIILLVSYRIGNWPAVWNALTYLIAFPVVVILALSLRLYLSLFLSNRKYREKIATILADYPHGRVIQISTERWDIISKSTEEPIAKIFLKRTGEIAKVNLKSKI